MTNTSDPKALNSRQGTVYLVGSGPGDPRLITVRGLELLRRADVVLHDQLSHMALLDECPATAELRDVGKRGGKKSPSQGWITAQLIELAEQGRDVVRLKGGDSFIFARGAEEAEALSRAGVRFEVIPGISSPVATSAYAGISLTHRDFSSSVTFITGSDKVGKAWSPEAWQRLATATATICVLMGMRRIKEICDAIIDGGRSPETPAAVIQWGARPQQRVLTAPLSELAERSKAGGFSNPAVIVVGEVVSLRETLSWFEKKPLFSKRVLVPRPKQQARATAHLLRERSAEPVVFPMISIVDPPDLAPLRTAISKLASYDLVLFTSANGVGRFFSELAAQGGDARAFGSAKVGVIGPKTAEALREHGITPDLEAREFVGEGLLTAIEKAGKFERVLLARGLVGRAQVPDALKLTGASVEVVPVYETLPVGAEAGSSLFAMFEAKELDCVLFTSSSTVHSMVEVLGDRARECLSGVVVASIGPITSEACRENGIEPDLIATEYTVPGLLDALEQHYLSQAPS
ncbi:MAG: uroporphyrinogen-III C-methyltransferase [Polyangiaceae bacterium]|nr:uroporphyrinogen-III C-methyltransferase [Polyangiaceae bacterium]